MLKVDSEYFLKLKKLVGLEEVEEAREVERELADLNPTERELRGHALLEVVIDERSYTPAAHLLVALRRESGKPLPIFSFQVLMKNRVILLILTLVLTWSVSNCTSELSTTNPTFQEVNQAMFSMHKDGNKRGARKLARKAIEMAADLHGTESGAYANALHHAGWLAMDSRDYEKAEDYLKRSLALRIKLFGEGSEPVANDYGCLANVYSKLYSRLSVDEERMKLAETHFLKCIQRYEHLFEKTGQFKRYLKGYYENFRDFYKKWNKPELASTYNQKVLALA